MLDHSGGYIIDTNKHEFETSVIYDYKHWYQQRYIYHYESHMVHDPDFVEHGKNMPYYIEGMFICTVCSTHIPSARIYSNCMVNKRKIVNIYI